MRWTQRIQEMTTHFWWEAIYCDALTIETRGDCDALTIETRGEAKYYDPAGISDQG